MRNVVTSIIPKNRSSSLLITFKNVSEYYWTGGKIENEFLNTYSGDFSVDIRDIGKCSSSKRTENGILYKNEDYYCIEEFVISNGYYKMFKFLNHEKLFSIACATGKMNIVKYLNNKVDDIIKSMALKYCILCGYSLKAVKYLVNQNIIPKGLPASGKYLHRQVKKIYDKRRYKLLKFILKYNLYGYRPSSFVIRECKNSNLETVKFLIEKGVIYDLTKAEQANCIWSACESGNTKLCSFLSDKFSIEFV